MTGLKAGVTSSPVTLADSIAELPVTGPESTVAAVTESPVASPEAAVVLGDSAVVLGDPAVVLGDPAVAPADEPAGQPVIGVLCLETVFDKIPGHIRNPATFGFPVRYRVVKGATPHRVVTQHDLSLIEPFCEAAQELVAEGVSAITSGCGFLVLFQQELADAVPVPVFASSLVQLPMVHRMLAARQTVGVLTAKQASLTPRHLAKAGAESVPIRIAGMEDQQEFREVMLEGRRAELDVARLREEVLSVAGRLADDPTLGAVLLECTDLVPFASEVQRLLGVPVFDIVTLTNYVHAALSRQPYSSR